MKYIKILLGILFGLTPALALAQFGGFGGGNSNIEGLFQYILLLINFYAVPLIFAIAFILFLWNVYKYFILGGGDKTKVAEGQKFVLWSIVGFALMFSVWGLVNLMVNTLGFNNYSRPPIPTFGGSTSGGLFGGSSYIYPGGSSAPSSGIQSEAGGTKDPTSVYGGGTVTPGGTGSIYGPTP